MADEKVSGLVREVTSVRVEKRREREKRGEKRREEKRREDTEIHVCNESD